MSGNLGRRWQQHRGAQVALQTAPRCGERDELRSCDSQPASESLPTVVSGSGPRAGHTISGAGPQPNQYALGPRSRDPSRRTRRAASKRFTRAP
jgi:hypothetical protein